MFALKKTLTSHLNESQFRLIQDVRYELHLQLESLKNKILPSRRTFLKDVKKKQNLKLHWGCGPKHKEGWVNVDGWATEATDIVFDMRKPLPFSDGSVSMIFTEHVHEHFTQGDGETILRDFHRVLKQGGNLRVIVPDLKIFAERYLENDTNFMTNFYPKGECIGEGVNKVFYGHFHRAMYDYDMLHAVLKNAGFSLIKQSDFRASDIAELNQEADEASRTVLNLYVDAVK